MNASNLEHYLPGFAIELDAQANILQTWPNNNFIVSSNKRRKKSFVSYIHQKQRDTFKLFFELLLTKNKKSVKVIQLRLVNSNKEEKWFTLELKKKSAAGCILSATEYKPEANEPLPISQLHKLNSFKRFIENLPFPFASCTANFDLTFVNKKFKEVFGYELEEIKKYKNWFSLFKWDYPGQEDEHDETFYTALSRFKENPNSKPVLLQRQLVVKDKTVRNVDIHFNILNDEIFGILEDVTEKKKIEQELIKSHDKFRNIAEHIPMPLITANLDLSINFVNQKFIEFTGLSLKEVQSFEDWHKYLILSKPEDKAKNLKEYHALLKKYEQNRNMVFPVLRKKFKTQKGDIKDVHLNFSIFDNQIYCILEDVTSLKNTERELKNSQHQLRALTSYLQKIREEERKFIAREIHDELGQLITALKIDIGFTKKKVEKAMPEIGERLNETMQLADKLIKSVRRISTSLRPSLLDEIGLMAAIEWECKQLKLKYGLGYNFKTDDQEIELKPEQKSNLFRIFQEATTNIVRHSNATHIKVCLQKENGRIFLLIADNGKGFDLHKKSSTLGILGIKERVHSLKGDFDIHSTLGKGTEITIKLPV